MRRKPHCLFVYVFTPFLLLRAGDASRLRTETEAGVEGRPMVLEVSKAGRRMREMPPAFTTPLMREPGFESSSAIGRGRSEATGVWPWRRSGRCGGGGLWSAVEGRPWAPWNSGRGRREGWTDGLRGLSRNGSPCERRTDVDAGYDGHRELALAFE